MPVRVPKKVNITERLLLTLLFIKVRKKRNKNGYQTNHQ